MTFQLSEQTLMDVVWWSSHTVDRELYAHGVGVGSLGGLPPRPHHIPTTARVGVFGIIIPALYSQQITSDLYVEVNPGGETRRGDVPQRAASATSQREGIYLSTSYKHNETTVPFTPDPEKPCPPLNPRIRAHGSANLIHSTAGSQHKGDESF